LARNAHVVSSRVFKTTEERPVDFAVLEPLRDQGSRFVGRRTLRVDAARIVAILVGGRRAKRLEPGDKGQVFLDETPFYAESGGQVGDQGWLLGGAGRARVTDAHSPLPTVILHEVEVEQGHLAEGDIVIAEVDGPRRAAIRRHHTATHLLHSALRQVLGGHVRQSGSLVAPDRLRFDFAHYEGVGGDALTEIEDLVNQYIVADLPVDTRELPLEQALHEGAIAFFGDRYGDVVRVVKTGEASMELCGGTHVDRSGEIGAFLVTSERGVAAGVRRIEAVCGPAAVHYAREGLTVAEQAAGRLGVAPAGLVEAVDKRLESLRQLQKESDQLRLKLARGESAAAGRTTEVEGVTVIARRADGLGRSQRRELADTLRQKTPASVVVLGAVDEDKAALLVAIGPGARDRVDAREVMKKLAPIVGGGGGGRPDLVEAGGKNAERLDEALAHASDAVRELLAGR
jgi:alanyl-tRNA synthetase